MDKFAHQPAPRRCAEPPKDFYRLRRDGEARHITRKLPYRADGTLPAEIVEQVFDFAYRMTYGGEGAHRNRRIGSDTSRGTGMIFANAFQGKLAESAMCEFFRRRGRVIEPDFSVAGLGEWDSADLTVDGLEISVKSTKSFGNLLLLECTDWDREGRYIPNIDQGVCSYDCIILVRIAPNCEEILQDGNLLHLTAVDRERLWAELSGQSWTYQWTGFITKSDLLKIISDRYIIYQGNLLNGKASGRMQVDNYYVQASDLRQMSEYDRIFGRGE